jgi:hypothetical protein
VGDRSRGRFATPVDSPLQECSPYRGFHVRRERLGAQLWVLAVRCVCVCVRVCVPTRNKFRGKSIAELMYPSGVQLCNAWAR